MKKCFVTLLAIILGYSCLAQPTSFFGLKLGEKYSLEEMVAAVGENGTYFDSGQLNFTDTMVLDVYYFSDVKYGDSYFPLMGLQFFTTTGKLAAASFCYVADEDTNNAEMEQTYKQIADTVQVKYPMQLVQTEDLTLTRLVSIGVFSQAMVRLDKYMESDRISSIELTYMSTFDLALELLSDEPVRPDVQDTFLGLKFGEKYTQTQVKSAFFGRGTFMKEDRLSPGVGYSFKDVSFGGRKWDFGNVYMTGDSEFYCFYLYDSLDNTARERRGAKSDFESLKAKLDEKYGSIETEVKDDGSLSATYLGGNDVGIILSLDEQKAASGLYRLYFSLNYIHKGLLQSVTQSMDDEL